MLANFSIAVLDFLKGIRISEEEIENRRKACEPCEFKSRLILDYCDKCKCILEGPLGKLKAPKEKCPENKW